MHVVKARTLEAKTKDKARILEAKSKAKARTLKAKAKDVIFCPRGSSRPRPVLEDYITGHCMHLFPRGQYKPRLSKRPVD
jgi:hypothetical protein